MNIQPPGKKVQALIIIITALFLGYFLYSVDAKGRVVSFLTKADNSAGGLNVVNTPNSDANLDSDKDGLKDWQEVLWGTDKNNPDTDGDGTPDGEEVAEGRDPVIKGPNDTLDKTRGIATSSIKTLGESVKDSSNNLTESLSKNLFANFMSLNANNTLDANSQQQLVNGLVSNIDPGTIPPQYTIADLNIFPSSPSALRTYGNQLAKTIVDFQAKVGTDSTNDFALATYQDMMEKLKNLPVPGNLGLIHLQILNNFNASYQSLSSIDNYQDDPAKAIIAMKTFQTNGDEAKELFKSVANEMQKNGIIFSTKESGHIWNDYQ